MLDQHLSWIIKTSKRCHLNVANWERDTESKTSPRHINFLKQLKKTTENNVVEFLDYDTSGQPTSAPKNTWYSNSTSKYTTYAHNNQKIGQILRPLFIFFIKSTRSWKKKNVDGFSNLRLRIFHFYPRCAPWGSGGPAKKLHPGFTLDKLVQPSQGISIFRDSDIVLSKRPYKLWSPELPHRSIVCPTVEDEPKWKWVFWYPVSQFSSGCHKILQPLSSTHLATTLKISRNSI